MEKNCYTFKYHFNYSILSFNKDFNKINYLISFVTNKKNFLFFPAL